MKKTLIFLLGITSLLLTGCLSKEVISSDKFTSTLEKYNYEVNDVTESYDMQTSFKKVLHASKQDATHQIEFYIFSDEETAIQMYNNQVMIIENDEDATMTGTVEGTNYNKFTEITSDTYSVAVQVENTLLYTSAEKSYKEEINDILEELGY